MDTFLSMKVGNFQNLSLKNPFESSLWLEKDEFSEVVMIYTISNINFKKSRISSHSSHPSISCS